MKAMFEGTAFAVAFMLVAPNASVAGDLAAGREKATPCGVCHGSDGIATRPDAPNIAGQTDLYLRSQLADYRSGRRMHPVMNVVAQGLSDEDIDDLVSWYSSIKLTVELPE